ncbi:choline/ethanolamine kinase [Aethina tumida]|uniref:choline/ethanolamine kinase n=1 Tax=Aethina tumida TaxID=116153 RepID=UPI0021497444|nr:choline/ethanolamine kinase [Aethina tumida]XP_049824908.1 choline/ethanolamine kinase [Aethina tumida]
MSLSSTKKMTGDCVEMRELAARICRDYLNGAWKMVTSQNIGFKHISGGLSNLLFHISLPADMIHDEKNKKEPNEVLIRVYGQTHGERALEALITDSVIFTLLSERGLGPKLHGIFPGGRIEQYINARPLLTRELADQKLSMSIAQNMATIHSMEVPLHKEPRWLWDTINRWLQICEAKMPDGLPDYVQDLLQDVDMKEEAVWLKRRLEKENSPVVFCHNDMQEGNILMSRDSEQQNNNEESNIYIIDFEYCSYNYRSFDIANHFVEWTYDYTEKDPPYYREDKSNYPTELQRMRFVKAYLNELGSRENPKKVLKEVEVFTMASHFFWSLWAFINVDTSQIPFGYSEYGYSRLSNYLQLKKKLNNAQLKRKMDTLE